MYQEMIPVLEHPMLKKSIFYLWSQLHVFSSFEMIFYNLIFFFDTFMEAIYRPFHNYLNTVYF